MRPRIEILDADGNPERPEEPQATIDDDIAKQLDDILAEFNQTENDVTWITTIHKINSPGVRGAREAYCTSVDPAELGGVRDMISRRFGPGIYRLRVRRNGRNFRQFDYEIAQAIEKPDEKKGIETELLSRMDAMERRNGELIQQVLAVRSSAPPPPPAFDPMQMMTAMATMLATLNGLVPKQIAGPVTDPMDTMTKTIDMVAKINDMRGDGGEGDTGVLGIVKEVVRGVANNPDALTAILQPKAQTNGPNRQIPVQPRQVQSQPSQPNRSDVVQPQTGVVDGQQNDPLAEARAAIQYLNSRAARGSEIELYAAWVFDNAPEDIVKTMLETPNALDMLAVQFPGMVPYRPWYERLLAEMKAFAQDEGAYAEVPGAQSGPDASNGETSPHASGIGPGPLDRFARPAGNVGDAEADGEAGAQG